jgi:hypothetical protein
MQQSNIVSRSRQLNGARKIYWNVGNPIYIRDFSKKISIGEGRIHYKVPDLQKPPTEIPVGVY